MFCYAKIVILWRKGAFSFCTPAFEISFETQLSESHYFCPMDFQINRTEPTSVCQYPTDLWLVLFRTTALPAMVQCFLDVVLYITNRIVANNTK